MITVMAAPTSKKSNVLVKVGGAHGWIKPTPCGAVISGVPLEADFEECLQDVKVAAGAVKFILGDLLVAGEKHYGQKYARWADITGYDIQTLYDIAATCRKFPLESRRAETLSFTHHQELKNITAQAAEEWMDAAEKHDLSTQRLRKSIKLNRIATKKDMAPAPSPAKDDQGHDNIHPHVNALVAYLGRKQTLGEYDEMTVDDLIEFAHDLQPVVRRFTDDILRRIWQRGTAEEVEEVRKMMTKMRLGYSDVVAAHFDGNKELPYTQ